MKQSMNSLEIVVGDKPKKNMGRANKRKGSHVERVYAKIFRDLGHTKCGTTRQSSRILDDCAVDLNFIPLLVQIKAGKQQGLNVAKVLQDMKDRIAEKLPKHYPEQEMVKIVVHHRDMPKGQRVRTPYDSIVSMTFDDFVTMFAIAFPGENIAQNDIQNK